jgi:hypothetical protein
MAPGMREKLFEHRSSPLAKPFGHHQLRDLGGDLATKQEGRRSLGLLFDKSPPLSEQMIAVKTRFG